MRKACIPVQLLTSVETPAGSCSSVGYLQEKVVGEAWGAALARAKGQRVLDDPARLRRSLKKDRKTKEKRQAAWKQRLGAQAEQRGAKQKKWVQKNWSCCKQRLSWESVPLRRFQWPCGGWSAAARPGLVPLHCGWCYAGWCVAAAG